MTIPQQNTDELRSLLVSVDFDKKQIHNDGIEFYDHYVEVLFHTRDSQENVPYVMSNEEATKIFDANNTIDHPDVFLMDLDVIWLHAGYYDRITIISACLDRMVKEILNSK